MSTAAGYLENATTAMTEEEARALVSGLAVSYVDCIHEFGEQDAGDETCLCRACVEMFAHLEAAVKRLKQAQEAAFQVGREQR
jgi:hypothetical protein